MARIIFMLIQLLLLFCCVTTARRLAPLISDETAKRSSRIAGNQTCALYVKTCMHVCRIHTVMCSACDSVTLRSLALTGAM